MVQSCVKLHSVPVHKTNRPIQKWEIISVAQSKNTANDVASLKMSNRMAMRYIQKFTYEG